jgi:hypothetical protein
MKKCGCCCGNDYISSIELQECCEKNNHERVKQLIEHVKPNGSTWEACFKYYRLVFIKLFIKNNCYPNQGMYLKTIIAHANIIEPFQLVSHSLCRNAVYCIIGIGKRLGQPYSHLFVLIAKYLWRTKNDMFTWAYALEWED